MPTLFDLTAHYEASADFRFSSGTRSRFASLARRHDDRTWLLGRYGGRARLHSDIHGIGTATRVEVGRLSLVRRTGPNSLVTDAFQLFQEAQESKVASGPIDRILVGFRQAEGKIEERSQVQQAFSDVFDPEGCNFLLHSRHLLELGYCRRYQILVQYLREDGLYHSDHRDRVELIQRHLQEQVGRYENHSFWLRPDRTGCDRPEVTFCYTGPTPDHAVEVYLQTYVDETPEYVEPKLFQARRSRYVSLDDYERASRRFGSLWVLQGDVVRHLPAAHVGGLYLFFDQHLQPEIARSFSWEELYQRQCRCPQINLATRNSATYLDLLLEHLVEHGFVCRGAGFTLHPDFLEFMHVSFDQLGEHRRRG